MPRSARVIESGGLYHITCRGNDRAQIFHDQNDYAAFLGIIRQSKRRFDYELFHYALMPNHYHLLLRPAERTPLALVMQYINQSTAVYYKHRRDHVGRLFQDRYYSSLIADDNYLFIAGIYIELNACRAGLVSDPTLYPWSSARHYLCGDSDPLINDDPLVLSLASDVTGQQKEYRRLVDLWRDR